MFDILKPAEQLETTSWGRNKKGERSRVQRTADEDRWKSANSQRRKIAGYVCWMSPGELFSLELQTSDLVTYKDQETPIFINSWSYNISSCYWPNEFQFASLT